MKTLIIVLSFITLIACTSTNFDMKFIDKSPRGISVLNIKNLEQAKAYRHAEKHCAKYSKVPRVLKREKQEQKYDFDPVMVTMKFECIKPSN